MAVLDHDFELLADRPGLLLIADKGYASAELDRYLTDHGIALLRPSYRNRTPRPGQRLLAPIRQLIESVHRSEDTRLNSSHANISYAVFCLKKNKTALALLLITPA